MGLNKLYNKVETKHHLIPLDPPQLLLYAPLLLLHLLLGGLVQRGELTDERLVLRLANLYVN